VFDGVELESIALLVAANPIGALYSIAFCHTRKFVYTVGEFVAVGIGDFRKLVDDDAVLAAAVAWEEGEMDVVWSIDGREHGGENEENG